jgi:hypothetical protein
MSEKIKIYFKFTFVFLAMSSTTFLLRILFSEVSRQLGTIFSLCSGLNLEEVISWSNYVQAYLFVTLIICTLWFFRLIAMASNFNKAFRGLLLFVYFGLMIWMLAVKIQ